MIWIVVGFLVYYVCNVNVQGYGLMELIVCCIIVLIEVDDMVVYFGVFGLFFLNVQVMVVDLVINKFLFLNKQGEFWIWGLMIMKGEF